MENNQQGNWVPPNNQNNYTQPQQNTINNDYVYAPIMGNNNQNFRPQVREVGKLDKYVLIISLILGIIFDRLVIGAINLKIFDNFPIASALFFLIFTIVMQCVFWKKVKTNKTAWTIFVSIVLLCSWFLVFDYRSSGFGSINAVVIPISVIGYIAYICCGVESFNIWNIMKKWCSCIFVFPFINCTRFTYVIDTSLKRSKGEVVKKVLIGLSISIPLILCFVLPMLASADKVFAHYLQEFLEYFSIQKLFAHIMIIILISVLSFSFIISAKMDILSNASEEKQNKFRLDTIISAIVLSSIVIVYLIFCWVQFGYLFGFKYDFLKDLVYSSYAKQGFGQLLVVVTVNLILFAVFLTYSNNKHIVMIVLLSFLLATTLIMIISSCVRLMFYVDAYGLTWKRVLGIWFIIYLVFVLVFAVIKMFSENFQVGKIATISLIVWFVVLGYLNPTGLSMRYNLKKNDYSIEWLEKNRYDIKRSPNDAIIEIIKASDKINDKQYIQDILDNRKYSEDTFGFSSTRLSNAKKKYNFN